MFFCPVCGHTLDDMGMCANCGYWADSGEIGSQLSTPSRSYENTSSNSSEGDLGFTCLCMIIILTLGAISFVINMNPY